MKLSTYIARLQSVLAAQGDLDVVRTRQGIEVEPVRSPVVLQLHKKYPQRLWDIRDKKEDLGDPVIVL